MKHIVLMELLEFNGALEWSYKYLEVNGESEKGIEHLRRELSIIWCAMIDYAPLRRWTCQLEGGCTIFGQYAPHLSKLHHLCTWCATYALDAPLIPYMCHFCYEVHYVYEGCPMMLRRLKVTRSGCRKWHNAPLW